MENNRVDRNIDLQANYCTGCGACANICPVTAITMSYNEEGFLAPQVDDNKCMNCGFCIKTCPSIHTTQNKNNPKPYCYAAMAENDIRMESSSGGIFTLLAEYILKNNGYICGAVYDDEWTVKHTIINKYEDLYKLKKSKYMQSNTNFVFRELKAILENNQTVLFVSTPCQIAGLKNYLKKDYDNLYLVDLICGGGMPPALWKRFLQENYNNQEIKDVDFRNKELGWNCVTTTTTTDKGIFYSNEWMDMHINCLAQRKSCPDCIYKTLPRLGDITIADFWGLQNYDRNLVDKKGTSLILTNNSKGEFLFNQIKNSFKMLREIPLEFAKDCPQALVKNQRENSNREKFFYLLKNFPISTSLKCVLQDKYDVGIMGLWFYENYGAILTQVALHKLIETFGLIPVLIDNSGLRKEPLSSNWAKDFCKKWCNLTEVFYSSHDLSKLNDKINTFISGSDQLWANQPFEYSYFLDYVYNNKKKIAVATSFGHNYLEYNNETVPVLSYYLKKYDLITVRENSGVEICREQLNVDAKQILDPVFLVDKKFYDKISKSSSQKETEPFIVTYIFRHNKIKSNYINKLSKEKHLKVIEIEDAGDEIRAGRTPVNVEDFLWYFQNAKYIITDSFHGTCFALIFNKKFITFSDNKIGDARFSSLMNYFPIKNRCVYTDFITEVLTDIDEKIDYTTINSKISECKNRDISLLKEAIFKRETKYLSDYDVLKIEQWNFYDSLMECKHLKKYKLKYFKYRLLQNFVVGHKKEYYKSKKKLFKEKIEKIDKYAGINL